MSKVTGGQPLGWVKTTLSEVTSVSRAKEEPANFGDVPYIGLEHIESGSNRLLSVGTVADVKSTKSIFQRGDVLYGKLRPYLKKVCRPDFDGVCSTDILVFSESSNLDNGYLLYFLSQQSTTDYATQNSNGINLPRISSSTLGEIEFPFPPLAEQRRIVVKIEALQERSQRARESLSEVGPLLGQFRQSMLAAAFRGDLTADWRTAHPNVEPASELLHRIRAERRCRWEQAELAKYEAKGQKPPKNWKEKYEEPESVDGSDLPELPTGWEWSNFDEVSLIDGGLTKHKAKRSKATNFVPLISVAAVQHGYIDSKQVSEIGLLPTDGDKGKLENNDLLVVEGNGSLEHIGRAALWDASIENARHQNHLIRVRPVLLDPRFSLHWLGSPRGRTNLVSEATSAAGLYNLSLGKIGRVHIPIPPLDEQTEIIKQLDAACSVLRSVVDLQRSTVDGLNQLDQAILAKAFRGELVPQDPNDEPASVLLERIREQRAQQAGATKRKKKTATTQQKSEIETKSSVLASPRQLLADMRIAKSQPMAPEQLLLEY